eukprot:TRINITY_DN419_c0_g1_i1.p1 TRINITY_DN419_c0_g1~~TRINITY_DN419_c0_g1_i1.p1  ORF type:complete len:652 (-),score=79.58 TRINITY_DN419_c0_g1_i1:40-1995(-)
MLVTGRRLKLGFCVLLTLALFQLVSYSSSDEGTHKTPESQNSEPLTLSLSSLGENQPNSLTDLQNEPDSQNEPDLQNEPDSLNEPDSQNEPDLQNEPDSQNEPDLQNEPDSQNEPDLQNEPNSLNEPDSQNEPDLQNEPNSLNEPDSQNEPDLQNEPDSLNEDEYGNLKPENSPIYLVGIISNRPSELENLLESLRFTEMDPRLFYVWDDSPSHLEAIDSLIKEFGVNEVNKSSCRDKDALVSARGGPLTAKYWCLFEYLFEIVRDDVQGIIILEDDLLVSPDFFDYFRQAFPVLMSDTDAWCISAWNDNGWPGVISNPGRIRKQEHFGGLGWGISKREWENDLKYYEYRKSDRMEDAWDSQVEKIFLSKSGRTCIYPEIPRTHHNSLSVSSGNSASSALQRNWFTNMQLNQITHVEYEIDQLRQYDDEIMKSLSRGYFISCMDDALSFHNSTLIVFWDAESHYDAAWKRIGQILDNNAIHAGGWKPLRTVYKGLLEIVWGTNRLFVVGSYSPFVSNLRYKFEALKPLKTLRRTCGEPVVSKKYWQAPYEHLFVKRIGQSGESCDEVCATFSQSCDPHFFHHLNQEIREQQGEEDSDKRCSLNSLSLTYPTYTTDGNIIFSSCARWYGCSENPKENFQRVCPCVDEILLYQ